MDTPPVPVPELVIEPVGFTEVVDKRIPLLTELLLFKTRLPVPEIPPEIVRTLEPLALLFVIVVPALFTVKAVVLMVSADVELLSVTEVTLDPTPPLIVTDPVPEPELVIVPVLFTEFVMVIPPPALLLFWRVRFPVPLMPPDTANE